MFYHASEDLVYWKTLDRLVLPSLRETHPLGPVRRVDVLSCFDYLEGPDTKDPVTLLTQLSPVVFCCRVWRSSLSFYPVLAKTLHSLRYLDLTIKTEGKQYWDNVDGPSEEKLLEHVRAHVDRVCSCRFALTGMRIRVDAWDCERVTADVLLRMALHAARILISLNYIGVGGISTNWATWYRVWSHDGEQPVLEALPARDAVKVERELLDTQRS
ncbi:hypothetical protein SCP_1600470 [Sparassis crispa]|uniref:Uncharacterized protein n=1 Tax=Sparassis crispa TaxID=139825 RepID=A0A401H4L5_9APHY|nr:hypothetical protein SCP_1600470 [Sparassis crispa]GBE89386.1 hypothetical protein SCP_1600470 [Sparassis crispa]